LESPRAKYSYLNDADTDVSNTWMAEEIRILLGQRRLGVGGEKKAIDVIVIIVLLHSFHLDAPLWGSGCHRSYGSPHCCF